jgi:hypothetical protein
LLALAPALGSACARDTLELFPGDDVVPDAGAATSTDADAGTVDAATGIADSTAPARDGLTDDDGSPPTILLESGAPCQTDNDCSGENHRCQTGLHICVQCIGDPTDCAAQGTESKCNLVNYTCAVPCAPDGGCPAPDVCDSQGVCADCLVSAHCPANQPRCIIEECVCLSSADCEGGVCGPDQTCM